MLSGLAELEATLPARYPSSSLRFVSEKKSGCLMGVVLILYFGIEVYFWNRRLGGKRVESALRFLLTHGV